MSRRPSRIDVALAAMAVLPTWAAMAAHLEAEARPADPVGVLLIGALALPMLIDRRRPVRALLVSIGLLYAYYLLGYSAVGLAVPLAPALYTVAEAGRLRVGVAAGATVFVLSNAWRLFEPAASEDASVLLGYDFAVSGLLMAAVLALGDAVRSRRGWQLELERRLQLAEVEREAEASRRVAEDRVRVSREVHDVVGHSVAVITLHAAVAAEALDDDREAVRRALGTIRDVSRDVLRDLSVTIGLLRDPSLPRAGLSDVAALVESTTGTGLDVRLRVEGQPRQLPAEIESTAHRLVQEALTNVLRHAHATSAEVTVEHDAHELRVTVRDDGRGCAGDGSSGHGLVGMRERVTLLAGSLVTRNLPAGGFEVCAVLPVDADRVQAPA